MSGSSGQSWAPSLWKDTFDGLMDDQLEYEDRWSFNLNYSLTDELTDEERKKGWKICQQCAYGNFQCKCGKTWGSARVTMLFHYRLRGNRGTVLMRPFKQACRECPDVFSFPGFTIKVVDEVLQRLFYKIRKNCYKDIDDSDTEKPTDANRKFTKPHRKALCEACHQGICSQEEDCE